MLLYPTTLCILSESFILVLCVYTKYVDDAFDILSTLIMRFVYDSFLCHLNLLCGSLISHTSCSSPLFSQDEQNLLVYLA